MIRLLGRTVFPLTSKREFHNLNEFIRKFCFDQKFKGLLVFSDGF